MRRLALYEESKKRERKRMPNSAELHERRVVAVPRGVSNATAVYAKRARNRPYVERRRKIEARMKELPAVEVFPEGGIERLDMLAKQRRSLLDERTKNLSATEARRLRRLQMNVDREECARRSQVI